MESDPTRFDTSLRAALGSRWARYAVLAAASGCGAAGAAAAFGHASAVWPLFVVGGAILLLALPGFPRLRTARVMVFASALAVLAVAPLGPADTTKGVAAAVLLAGLPALAVFEPRGRALTLTVALTGVLAGAVWLAAPEAATLASGIPLVVAGVITIGLLTDLRNHLAERGAALTARDLQYRDLLDRVPVGLYRTGLGGELLEANPALADLLGASRDDILGGPVQRFLVDPRDLERLRVEIPRDGTPLVTDLRFRRADGRVIWVRDRTRAVLGPHGAPVCFEGELQDITQQVEHVERLQALIKSKSDLIAAVSHELRTPLTAVVGYLDLLAAGPLDEAEEMLAMAAEQAHEVAAIVDDLLTAARLDNRELVVHAVRVDVVEAVRSAVRSLGNPYVLLALPLQLAATGDAARVRQILRNLIGNAYRYGKPPVSIHADTADGVVRVVVADRGDPIGPEVQAQMFEPFFTTGLGDSQPGAIGLGLAVSRQLARRMGGDLRHDRVGSETRFTLLLPVADASTRAA